MDYEQFNRFLHADLEVKALEEAYNKERSQHYRDIRPAMTFFDFEQGKILQTGANVEKEGVFLYEMTARFNREKRYVQQRIDTLNEAVQMLYPNERQRFSQWRKGCEVNKDVLPTLKKCLEYILVRKQIEANDVIVDDELALYDAEIDAMGDDELFDDDFYYDPLDTFDAEIIATRQRDKEIKQKNKDVYMSSEKVISLASVKTELEDSLLYSS